MLELISSWDKLALYYLAIGVGKIEFDTLSWGRHSATCDATGIPCHLVSHHVSLPARPLDVAQNCVHLGVVGLHATLNCTPCLLLPLPLHRERETSLLNYISREKERSLLNYWMISLAEGSLLMTGWLNDEKSITRFDQGGMGIWNVGWYMIVFTHQSSRKKKRPPQPKSVLWEDEKDRLDCCDRWISLTQSRSRCWILNGWWVLWLSCHVPCSLNPLMVYFSQVKTNWSGRFDSLVFST